MFCADECGRSLVRLSVVHVLYDRVWFMFCADECGRCFVRSSVVHVLC